MACGTFWTTVEAVGELDTPAPFGPHQAAGGYDVADVEIATVEKVQGQEKDLTIVCYAAFDSFDSTTELDFVYSAERINTAITRARKKCIVLCSPAVLAPSLKVVETGPRERGFTLLRHLAAHCPPLDPAAHRRD